MKDRFSSKPGPGLRFSPWPAVLAGIVVLKAVLSLVLKPESPLLSYGGTPYFVLLLLATGFAIQNGVQNTLRSRPFWVLLSIAYGLWTLNQWIFLYYQFGPHIDVPDNSIADPLLFMHVPVLMAAVATLPHRNLVGHRLLGMVLNSFLILIFWGFLYFYAVFPYQLFSHSTGYALGFDTLYPLENWALIFAVVFLSLRASAPWRSIYLHLLGASTLYAVSSAVANFAVDSSGYLPGRLYGIGLTAAVCWFVWIPLRARQLAGTETKVPRPDTALGSQVSAWAMLAVVLISIPIAWELLRGHEPTGMPTFRLLVAIAAIVCLAGAAFLKEHLAKSELASRFGSANQRLQWAMESGKAVGWEWDVKTGLVSWFGDLKTSFGVESDTYVQRQEDFYRNIHPEDRQRITEAVADAKRNHALYSAEFRVVYPNGDLHWIAAKGEFRYSAKGEPERMTGTAIDITDQKQLKTELIESQGRICAIVESSADAIISKNLDGIILSWNTAAQRLFEYTEQQAIGQPITMLIPEEILDEEREILRSIKDGKRIDHYETIRVTKSGRILHVSLTVSPVRDASGTIVGASKIARDITEQKRAEQGLHKSEERFRLFMDHSPAVAWMKDEQGHYIYLNETYQKHFGIHLEDRMGKTDLEIYPRAIAEQFRANDQAALAMGRPVEFTEESIDHYGHPCTWMAYKFPFHDDSGQIFVGGIGIDVTERMKAREALQLLAGRLIHAQEEERARIARELHDDFSQRLALLGIGLGQLWKSLPKSDLKERASVMEMLEAIKEITSDMHALSHQLHSSKLEHVGLVPALNGLCKEMGAKYQLDIVFNHPEVPLNLPKDVALCLFRVAQEALGNVVKHSGSNEAQVDLRTDSAGVTLQISDQGCGFDPRLQNSSAGIGMVGMTERLRLVGGQLVLKSQPDCGTVIVAEVPLATTEVVTQLRTQVAGR